MPHDNGPRFVHEFELDPTRHSSGAGAQRPILAPRRTPDPTPEANIAMAVEFEILVATVINLDP
jgi:hypothetical protein